MIIIVNMASKQIAEKASCGATLLSSCLQFFSQGL